LWRAGGDNGRVVGLVRARIARNARAGGDIAGVTEMLSSAAAAPPGASGKPFVFVFVDGQPAGTDSCSAPMDAAFGRGNTALARFSPSSSACGRAVGHHKLEVSICILCADLPLALHLLAAV
jgi:hypothetical protein